MGVIQLKHGSQSAAPTSLKNGEFAINIDSNQLWYGSGSNDTPISSLRLDTITAEKYVISSSVTHMTTSFSSGSTEFGDTTNDTHTFIGSITSSGNISSSGEIEANTFKAAGNVDFNGDLDVDGTANLDAVDIDGNVQLDGTLTVGVSGTGHDVTLFGDTHGKYIKWDQSEDLLDIRSETNFGTGGTGVDVTLFGDTLGKFMKWDQSMDHLKLYDNTNLVFGTGVSNEADFDASIFWDTADLVIDSETDIKIVADGGSVIVTGEITSSGNISSSGEAIVTNVSASGDIYYTGALIGNQREVYQCSFEGLRNTTKNYLPLASTDENTTAFTEENCIIVPTDGRVVSVTVRPTIVNSYTAGDLDITVETQPLNVSATGTTFTQEEEKTLSIGSSDANHAFHLVFDNDKHFETGELLAIGISYAAGYSPPASQYWYVTAVIEYNWREQGFTAQGEYDAAV